MRFEPEPLRVECQACGASAETWDYANPDSAVTCGCCPIVHDHAGMGCRPVTIWATAHITMFNISDLLEMAAEREILQEKVKEVI